ncbi:MAG: CBS domain-containing protein [Gammaproteobacteria bacterium]
MSLRWYRRPRLVVLKPNSPVLEAARAIERNRIGAVVVQDRGRVVGIVTDRDLAVRALGQARNPDTTPVADVMTESPVTLTPADSVADAVRLMQERNVRRIPLVEGERVVGMVTFDDLLLDEAAPLEALAAIVQAQIGAGGPAPAPRSTAEQRRLARTTATLTRWLNTVRVRTELEDLEQARTALDTVLTALVRRLTSAEANQLIAQLPALLQPGLRAEPPGPDKSVGLDSIVGELQDRLGVDAAPAEQILATVSGMIAGSISRGEAEDVRSQLPIELREVFRQDDRVPMFI